MREIKFRALRNGKTWWFTTDENIIFTDGFLCEQDSFYELEKIGEAYQYTGLKDKNGVEIYDSDGVKNEFGDIFIVNHFDYPLMSLLITMELEVIGNKYKNPELL